MVNKGECFKLPLLDIGEGPIHWLIKCHSEILKTVLIFVCTVVEIRISLCLTLRICIVCFCFYSEKLCKMQENVQYVIVQCVIVQYNIVEMER